MRTRSAALALLFLAAPAAAGPVPRGLVIPQVAADGQLLPPGAARRLGSARLQSGFALQTTAFSPDGRTLVTAGWGGGARAWDAATGRPLWAWRPRAAAHVQFGPVVVTPDGRSAWVGQSADLYDGSGTAALVRFDLATGRTDRRIPLGKGYSTAVGLSADGRRAAWWAGEANVIRVTDLAAGTTVCDFRPGANQVPSDLHLNRDGTVLAAVLNSQPHVGDVTAGGAGEKTLRPLPWPQGQPQAARVSPDGKRVVVIGGNKVNAAAVRVYDAATGKVACDADPPDETFTYWMGVTFTPDGKQFAVSMMDRDTVLYDAATGKVARRFPGHGGGRQVAFTADGQTMAGGRAGVVLWDVASGTKLPQSADLAACGFAGELTFSADSARLTAAGGPDDDLVTWDVGTGREVARVPGPEAAAAGYGVRTYYWFDQSRRSVRSPDGRRVLRPITPDRNGGKPVQNPGLAIDDAATGKELVRLAGGEAGAETHFSADGRLILASATRESQNLWTGVWDAASGRFLHRLKPSVTVTNNVGLGMPVIAPCPDGIHVAAIDGNQFGGGMDGPHTFTCGVYDAAAGREAARFVASGMLYKLVWAADGVTLIGTGVASFRRPDSGFVFVADRRTGRIVRKPFDTRSVPAAVAVSADGKQIATGSADGVRVWEAATGGRRHTLPVLAAGVWSGMALAFSPDNRWLAAGGGGDAVVLWDLRAARTGRPVDPERAWADLELGDSRAAYRAAVGLSRTPGAAAFLAKKIAAVPPPDPAKVAKLVAALDAPAFADREAAQKELVALGELAEPAVRRAAAESPSEEVRQRAAAVLKLPLRPAPDRLRVSRAVEAVGWMGTPESRALLTAWAAGADGAWLTREARAALK